MLSVGPICSRRILASHPLSHICRASAEFARLSSQLPDETNTYGTWCRKRLVRRIRSKTTFMMSLLYPGRLLFLGLRRRWQRMDICTVMVFSSLKTSVVSDSITCLGCRWWTQRRIDPWSSSPCRRCSSWCLGCSLKAAKWFCCNL